MLSRAGERLCRQGVTQYIGLAINNECILHCQVLYSLLSSSRDPFVLESNPSGHPSSVSGDPIARCKRWIEREILKPSVLIDCQLDGYQTIIIMSRSCQKLLVSPLKTSQSLSAFDNCRAFVIISQPFRVHFCNMQQAKSLCSFFSLSSGPAIVACVPNRKYCQQKTKKCSLSTMAEILLMFSFGVAHPDDPLFLDC